MKVLVSALFLILPTTAIADGSGWFGFSLGVDVSWRMTVKSAQVNNVAADSPAGRAGIGVGDQLTSIEDCAIPKCGAFKAQELLERAPGEQLNLRLKRPNGEEYSANLVAEKAPSN